jgi:threonine dehydrogenase-like Zn-dependent dehydrogenase
LRGLEGGREHPLEIEDSKPAASVEPSTAKHGRTIELTGGIGVDRVIEAVGVDAKSPSRAL